MDIFYENGIFVKDFFRLKDRKKLEARYFCFKEILNGMILMGENNNKEILKKHENEQNI